MARFTDLNEDVPSLILENFEYNRYILRVLTLTCSSLSRIATRLLYRRLGASFGRPHDNRSFHRLLRTLHQPDKTRSLQLMSYIRHVSVDLRCDDYEGMRDPETIRFLHSIESARTLNLSVYRGAGKPDLSFLDLSRFPHLRAVNLNVDLSSADLARFLSLPTLEIIRLRNPRESEREPVSIQTLPHRQKPLHELDLHACYPHDAVHEILSATGGVKKLSLHEPSVLSTFFGDVCDGASMTAMQSLYSPFAIGRALAPLQATLESLDLTTWDSLAWPGHDRTHLDLRGFRRLKDVRVNSKCFFPLYGLKKNVCGLLPPGVEKLQVRFDVKNSAVKNLVDAETDEDDYEWIVDVVQGAEDERGLFPRLARFSVVEEGFLGLSFCDVCVPNFGVVDWEPSAHVKAVLDGAAGLEVEVKLRRWIGKDEERDEFDPGWTEDEWRKWAWRRALNAPVM